MYSNNQLNKYVYMKRTATSSRFYVLDRYPYQIISIILLFFAWILK